MTSKIIRVDDEVKALLDRERRVGERNYNGAIKRLIERGRGTAASPTQPKEKR